MSDGVPILGSLYVYAPNKWAPIVFTVLYAISAAGHIWQCYRYKCFNMIGLHPICAVIFTIGYGLREYGAYNYMYNDSTLNLVMFIMSVCLIYICPPLLELANYQILGRIFYYVPHLSPMDPGRVLSTFGVLSLIVEVLNGTGVSLFANPSASQLQQPLGKYLTIAALALQLLIIAVFVPLAGIFHRRCLRAGVAVKAVYSPLLTLYISTALIFVRCIYRVVEKTGNTAIRIDDPESLMELSPTLRYEWCFYVFEAVLMFFNSILWNIRHPRRHLPSSFRVHLAEDGKTEVQGEDRSDGRGLIAHLVDPFGWCTGKRKTGEARDRGTFVQLKDRIADRQ